jgi:hypothetical protein
MTEQDIAPEAYVGHWLPSERDRLRGTAVRVGFGQDGRAKEARWQPRGVPVAGLLYQRKTGRWAQANDFARFT